MPLPTRLRELHEGLAGVICKYAPMEAAVEETFVNRDPQSALKLGQARGIALVVPALAGLSVAEYAANLIKKTVVGTGHAEKAQIAMMVKTLLPGSDAQGADAADALAAAITHARVRTGAEHRIVQPGLYTLRQRRIGLKAKIPSRGYGFLFDRIPRRAPAGRASTAVIKYNYKSSNVLHPIIGGLPVIRWLIGWLMRAYPKCLISDISE